MTRQEKATRYITKQSKGIEIGAFHSGIVPGREGYNSRILDVFDTETLRARARQDPAISAELEARIEAVDYIGSSTDIERLVGSELGQFDYIVSSHNIEHTPDPITLFQGCSKVLKPGGVFSMIVPDRRACYDYFRPNSATAALIDAYFAKRTRPTYAQIFEHQSLASHVLVGDDIHFTFASTIDPASVIPVRAVEHYFSTWRRTAAEDDEGYVDAHCWTFTPATFELILRDLLFLRLIDLEIIDIEPSEGEFFAHFRNGEAAPVSENEFYMKRHELLLRANDESSITSPRVRQLENDLAGAQAHAARLQSEVAELKASTSWRVTSVLRAARRILERGRHNPATAVTIDPTAAG